MLLPFILSCCLPWEHKTESDTNLFNLLFVKMYVILGEFQKMLQGEKMLIELCSAVKGGLKDSHETCLISPASLL